MLTLPCTEARGGFGSICHLQAHKHSHSHSVRARTRTHTPQIIFLRVDRMMVLGAERSKEYG